MIRTGGGLTAKRLGKDRTGGWVMISDNPAWPETALPDDARITGEVRWTVISLPKSLQGGGLGALPIPAAAPESALNDNRWRTSATRR